MNLIEKQLCKYAVIYYTSWRPRQLAMSTPCLGKRSTTKCNAIYGAIQINIASYAQTNKRNLQAYRNNLFPTPRVIILSTNHFCTRELPYRLELQASPYYSD